MKKIKMRNEGENTTIRQGFELFVVSQKAKGVAEKTVETYRDVLSVAGRHFASVPAAAGIQRAARVRTAKIQHRQRLLFCCVLDSPDKQKKFCKGRDYQRKWSLSFCSLYKNFREVT